MTAQEIKTLSRIPKKYRTHITGLTIEKSGDFNDKGQELNNYTVEWDNGEEHNFQNISFMIWAIKEYTDPADGYFYGA